MKNILCLFDYHASTGFSTVSENIIPYIKAHYGDKIKIDIIAINYFRKVVKKDGTSETRPGKSYEKDGIRVFPAWTQEDVQRGEADAFGRHQFLCKLLQNQYDLIFIMQDAGVMTSIVTELINLKRRKLERKEKIFKSIIYFPIDGPVPKDWADQLSFFDTIVTYTDFAKEAMVKCNPEMSRLKVIPHGTNTDVFKPLDKDESFVFRTEYFGENAHKFIVANFNRNQPRKDIPTTIHSFEKFLRGISFENKQPFLYLHMRNVDNIIAGQVSHDIRTIMSYTSLVEGKDWMLPSKDMNDISPEELNKIYNATDLSMTTTTGEGWGLTVTESMAAGIPVIFPMHTSLIEIAYGKGHEWYGPFIPYCNQMDNVVRFQSEIYSVSRAIGKVYSDKRLTEAYRQDAYNYATCLSWDRVSMKWIEEIDKLL